MKRLMLALTSAMCGTLLAADLDLDGTPVEITVDTSVDTLNVAAATEVTVSQGATLSAKRMTGAFKITKKGGGAIVVDAVDVGDTLGAIEVAAGAMSVKTHASAAGEVAWREAVCPVSDSFLRLDASVAATISARNEGVTKWADADGRERSVTSGTRTWYLPMAASTAPNGRPVVDFRQYRYSGIGGSGDHATGDEGGFLGFSETSAAVREVFFVVEQADNAYLVDIDRPYPTLIGAGEGWEAIDWVRGDQGIFGTIEGGGNYVAAAAVRNGLIEVDGTVRQASDAFPKGFHILHVRTTGPVRAAKLCQDRDRGRGGWKIAEAIIYERVLSDAEAASVTSYLNDKWFSAQGVRTVGDVTVADGATLTLEIGAGDTLAAGNVSAGGDVVLSGRGGFKPADRVRSSGGNIRFAGASACVGSGENLDLYTFDAAKTAVKAGAGTVAFGVLGADVKEIDVREGTLATKFYNYFGNNNHWMHLDASREDKLETETVDGVNYVKKWTSDISDNGNVLHYAEADGEAHRPFLNSSALPGRTVIDFGSLKTLSIDGWGGRLKWDTNPSQCKDLFMVVSDTEEVSSGATGGVGQSLLGYSEWSTFLRGSNLKLFGSGAQDVIRDSYIVVDGKLGSKDTVLTPGFHVVYLIGKGSQPSVNYFGLDATGVYGGYRIAEMGISRWDGLMNKDNNFKIAMTLAAKWLGGPYALDSIAVAPGAELKSEYSQFRAKVLTVGGTANLTKGLVLEESGTLKLTGSASALDVGVVKGSLTLPESATVELPSKGNWRSLAGAPFYVLKFDPSATVQPPSNIGQWQVAGLSARLSGRVGIDSTGIKVTVLKEGMNIILK